MSSPNLVATAEQLHRQVHKRKEDGTPMSLNFRPTPKDEDLLSTRQESVISPKEAHDDHASSGWATVGTWTFGADETVLDVIDDQHDQGMPKGHASVVFTGLSRRAIETESKRLALLARHTYDPAAASPITHSS